MKKYVLLMVLTVTLTQVHAQTDWSRAWSRLWRNADQRGEALLQSGDAAGAAKEYSDTQRKGHAALKAGDYVGAAQTLSTVDTTEAHYNRGNALAHAGDLQGALQAYDAALKRDPEHKDARHNRDVVAKALLEQQQKNEAQSTKPPKDGQQGESQSSKSGESQPDQQSSAKDGQPDSKKSDKGGKEQQGGAQGGGQSSQAYAKEGKQPTSNANASQRGTQEGTSGKSGKQSDSVQSQAPSSQADKPPQRAPNASGNTTDDAEQARRELAANAGVSKSGQAGAPHGTQASATGPMTEKQIAQEQWLRSIPDDPGGLLRRKFLIEHMLRHQGKEP